VIRSKRGQSVGRFVTLLDRSASQRTKKYPFSEGNGPQMHLCSTCLHHFCPSDRVTAQPEFCRKTLTVTFSGNDLSVYPTNFPIREILEERIPVVASMPQSYRNAALHKSDFPRRSYWAIWAQSNSDDLVLLFGRFLLKLGGTRVPPIFLSITMVLVHVYTFG